jgi:hypothetical protein
LTRAHLFLLLIVVGHAAAILWHRRQKRLGKPWPWSTFLYDPRCRFSDLWYPWNWAQKPQPYVHPGVRNVTPYFPLVYWAMSALTKPRLHVVSRVAYLSICAVLVDAWGWQTLPVLLGYPVLFSDDRGCLDHVLSAMSAAAVLLLFAGHPVYGAIVLGVTVALKGYTAPLGLLWLLQGQWLGIGAMAATAGLLVLLPARSFQGGAVATVRGMRQGMREFYEDGVLAQSGPLMSTCHYSIDWFNGVRCLFWWRDKEFDAKRWIRPYTVLSTLAALSLVWRASTTDETWVALMALGLVQCIWPHVANDYRLTALIPGIAFWMIAGSPGWIVLGCLVVLWIPKSYWFPKPDKTAASIACVVSPLAILGLGIGVWL